MAPLNSVRTWAGDINIIREQIAFGADIHVKCYFGHPDGPLREAVEGGHTEIVKLLLDNGANIHAKDCMATDAPLRRAILNDHLEIVALLLDRCADIHAANDRALRWAVECGRWKSIELLFDRGVTVNGAGNLWVFQAAENGYAGVVEMLLDHGADIHGGNDSALFVAAYSGHEETVELLIDYGNFRSEAPGLALIAYSIMGKTKDAEILISQRADVHMYDDAALHGAGGNQHSEIIALLVGHYEFAKLRAIQSTTVAPNILEAVRMEIQKRLDIKKALKSATAFEL